MQVGVFTEFAFVSTFTAGAITIFEPTCPDATASNSHSSTDSRNCNNDDDDHDDDDDPGARDWQRLAKCLHLARRDPSSLATSTDELMS